MENEEKKKSNVGKILIYVGGVIIAMVVSFMLGVGCLVKFFHDNPDYLNNTVTNITKTEKEVTVNENGIADAVEKVFDSVVIVENYVNGKLYGTGSGFIFKQDGNTYYLLTNHHVVSGGTTIKIVLTDGKSKTVKVEGSDVYADIAVLSFEVDDPNVSYTVAEIGSVNDLSLGDTVFVIGAPVDSTLFSGTVTRGIVSGKDRLIEKSLANNGIADWIMKVLQTDAAINGGNSGGPLCNSNGQVVGIANMKLNISGVESMNFAIPIDDAISYAEQLLENGKIERPYIGLSLNNASNMYYANYYGYSDELSGVVLTKIVSDSPADNAGLKVGDVITKVNDEEVNNVASFKYKLYQYNPGDSIEITYFRGVEEHTTRITLITNEN